MNQRTALLSVFNKEGIIEFAQALVGLGWNLVSSGGTADKLRKAGIPVTDVAQIIRSATEKLLLGALTKVGVTLTPDQMEAVLADVGRPILGHRVVTLSREVHAGLLATDSDPDIADLEQLGVPRLDMVCVDMYPLDRAIADPNATLTSVIEMTDIGGPTMLRSAAKGNRITICDPADRQWVLDWLTASEPDSDTFVNDLAAKAEYTVTHYCLSSARFRSGGRYDGLLGERVQVMLYGENGWQTPAYFYACPTDDPLALQRFKLVEGEALSYNNLVDQHRLLQTMTHVIAGFEVNFGFKPFVALVVKHGNACGAVVGAAPEDTLQQMMDCDSLAAFGGLVMTNFRLTERCGEILHSNPNVKFDAVTAPEIDPETIEQLKRKKGKCRFVVNPALATLSRESLDSAPIFRPVRGGFLKQPNYTHVLDLRDQNVNGTDGLSFPHGHDMVFAWAVGSTSTSNTITIAKDGQVLGNGVGQQARVYAARLARERARTGGHDHQVEGSTAYSDSFFVNPDAVEELAAGGVKHILTSSGSIHDKEILARAEELGVTLVMTPDKLGRGFFGH